MAGDDLERELDALYGVPLAEFVRARDELAKRLRKEDRREDADAVKALPKPSAPVWAVNQLARRERPRVEALVAASERLRAAQATGRSDFGEAVREERAVVGELVEAARGLLAETGRPPTDETLRRVGDTLRATATEDATRDLLVRGRLAEEIETSGFESLLALAAQAPPAPARERVREERKADAAERERARAELAEARTRAGELRREAQEARREAERARREWERADEAAREAAERAEEAEAEVARAEERLAALGGQAGAGSRART